MNARARVGGELQHIDTVRKTYQRNRIGEMGIFLVEREVALLECLFHLNGTCHYFIQVLLIIQAVGMVTFQLGAIDLHTE